METAQQSWLSNNYKTTDEFKLFSAGFVIWRICTYQPEFLIIVVLLLKSKSNQKAIIYMYM